MTQTYGIRLGRRAARALAAVERRDQQRIRAALDLLADNPRPPNCVAMKGEDSVYRVRVGDYRIVNEVIDGELLVLVIRIGHRSDVYR